jgi:hypothetical protein
MSVILKLLRANEDKERAVFYPLYLQSGDTVRLGDVRKTTVDEHKLSSHEELRRWLEL